MRNACGLYSRTSLYMFQWLVQGSFAQEHRVGETGGHGAGARESSALMGICKMATIFFSRTSARMNSTLWSFSAPKGIRRIATVLLIMSIVVTACGAGSGFSAPKSIRRVATA